MTFIEIYDPNRLFVTRIWLCWLALAVSSYGKTWVVDHQEGESQYVQQRLVLLQTVSFSPFIWSPSLQLEITPWGVGLSLPHPFPISSKCPEHLNDNSTSNDYCQIPQ